jgi:hypothetical protein
MKSQQKISLPDFICVGPGRAGTSWLYEVLLEHPQICMAKNIKETQFFDRYFDNGLKWYQTFFADCEPAKIMGEISNRYIFDDQVATRIKNTIPSCKIIICLRNPYDRIQSVYTFKLREGSLNCSFMEALHTMPQLITENHYHSLVEPYFRLFGRENIFLLFFDDIVNNPGDLCNDLFNFLGINGNFRPSALNRVVNQAIVPRFPFVSRATKNTARLMRTMGLYRLLTSAKRSHFIKRLLFKNFNFRSEKIMTQEAKALIQRSVQPEIDQLQKLIGRKLRHWS